MQKKLAILCTALSLLVGYMEWGGGNSAFVYEVEYQILFQQGSKTDSFTHPLVLLPFAGQALLLVALFQSKPGKRLVFIGLAAMGLLAAMLLLVGLLARSPKIVLSVLPFWAAAVWCVRAFRG